MMIIPSQPGTATDPLLLTRLTCVHRNIGIHTFHLSTVPPILSPRKRRQVPGSNMMPHSKMLRTTSNHVGSLHGPVAANALAGRACMETLIFFTLPSVTVFGAAVGLLTSYASPTDRQNAERTRAKVRFERRGIGQPLHSIVHVSADRSDQCVPISVVRKRRWLVSCVEATRLDV